MERKTYIVFWTKVLPLGIWEQELQAPTTMQGPRKEHPKEDLLQQSPPVQDNQQHSQGKVSKSHMPVNLNTPLITLLGLDALPPAGRTQHCMENWRKLTSDPWVLDVVKGYHLDLEQWPFQQVPPNPSVLSRKDQVLVQTEVGKMLLKGAICEVPPVEGEFLSRLFLVQKKDGRFRPVVNLKALNKFMTKNHFKMEGFHILKDVLQRGDWMSSIDLKDAYFSVPMARPHRKLLRFEWKGEIYEYQCLPFGLSSAPTVFTKLLKPILAWLRQREVRMIVYLDDILVLGSFPEEGKARVELIIEILSQLGFVINKENHSWSRHKRSNS